MHVVGRDNRHGFDPIRAGSNALDLADESPLASPDHPQTNLARHSAS